MGHSVGVSNPSLGTAQLRTQGQALCSLTASVTRPGAVSSFHSTTPLALVLNYQEVPSTERGEKESKKRWWSIWFPAASSPLLRLTEILELSLGSTKTKFLLQKG